MIETKPPKSSLAVRVCRGADTAAEITKPAGYLQPSLYRIIWRWHFYAGILVGPVLFVVAITGAMYVFKDELEWIIYPTTMFVTPQVETVSLDRQVAAVAEAYPNWRADTVEIDADPTRATSIRIRDDSSRIQRVYVNPHTGAIQGAIGDNSIFRVVLAAHRRLFIGTVGRAVVEIVTCWTIVLLVTGLYLWFPRRRKKLWGVFLPRPRAKSYTVLRDMHAISGACVMPIVIIVAGTGLVYSLTWGSIYRYVAVATEEGAATEILKSASLADSPPLPLDRAAAITRAHVPTAEFIDLQLPAKHDDALKARATINHRAGPRNRVVLTLDRSTGAVIDLKTSDRLPALSRWRTTWNYPLHVGSIMGTPTKIIWLIACLGLAALPLTGLWMWWKRRPTGQISFPRRLEYHVPRWLLGTIFLLGILLPVVGVSVLLILAGERLFRHLRSA